MGGDRVRRLGFREAEHGGGAEPRGAARDLDFDDEASGAGEQEAGELLGSAGRGLLPVGCDVAVHGVDELREGLDDGLRIVAVGGMLVPGGGRDVRIHRPRGAVRDCFEGLDRGPDGGGGWERRGVVAVGDVFDAVRSEHGVLAVVRVLPPNMQHGKRVRGEQRAEGASVPPKRGGIDADEVAAPERDVRSGNDEHVGAPAGAADLGRERFGRNRLPADGDVVHERHEGGDLGTDDHREVEPFVCS